MDSNNLSEKQEKKTEFILYIHFIDEETSNANRRRGCFSGE